ncbi:MAG: InlB B-repeat-containing protein [Chitinispirillales bacterium]|jgi:uncharacterized repeat protein (TIGR02543 family)|nr:InlB B-repeat-containing protein [Chitinispirillales bacterium]
MLTKVCRRLMVGVVAALGLCLPVAADVVFDDFEDGLSVNLYGGDWYTYESGYSPKINLPAFAISGGAGTMNLAGMNGAGENQEVAIGTNLKAAGMGSEWNGVQSITFKAKGPSGLVFNFYLNTLENDGSPANWNKHGKKVTISGTDWATYTVNLPTDLSQNSGGTTANGGALFTFDKAKVTKLAWSVKKAENTGVNSGTFAIDDIKLIGTIEDVDPTLCQSCVLSSFGAPTPRVLLNDFSTDKNALGYYDGHEYANEGTTATKGTVGREGQGVSIDFTVGGTGNKYVGISISLANDDVTTPLNANSFTGVYFEYKTTGINKMEFAVVEKSGAIDPAGKDFYKNLPPTNNEWKAAFVKFIDLELPGWAPSRTLDKTQLAKLQFAYKDAGAGTIAIDNIYFVGASEFPGQTTPPPNPPGPATKYALTYKVDDDNHGWVSVNDERRFSITDSVAAGASGPTVTAIPSSDRYRFVKWSDENPNLTRTDVATSNAVFTAIFEPQKFTITYKAGANGYLLIAGQTGMVNEYAMTLAPGVNGETVTAVGQLDPRYQFKGWSDGKTTASRNDAVTDGNLTFTAEFEEYVAPPVIEYVKVNYTAGPGGVVRVDYTSGIGFCAEVDCNRHSEWADSLAPGDSIMVTAVPEEGYTFFRWGDNVATATRTDKYADGAVSVEAIFNAIVPIDPELQYFVIAYSAGIGGKLREGNGSLISPIIRNVAADSAGPTITAVPNEGYNFVKWSDGFTVATRTDIAKSDSMLTAEFVSTDTASRTYRVTYVAGAGGKLSINGNYSVSVASYDTTVAAGANAAVITAIADSGYIFVGWSDNGSTDNPRFNTNVRADVSANAEFERRVVAVAAPNREIPTAPPAAEVVAVAPVAIIAGELTAGPNPTSAEVKFFRTGRAIKAGKLAVYDVSGNLVTTVNLNDKGTGGKRVVGSWNLKDGKGRQVANGSYVVKGTVTTKDGLREKVSTIIAVAK